MHTCAAAEMHNQSRHFRSADPLHVLPYLLLQLVRLFYAPPIAADLKLEKKLILIEIEIGDTRTAASTRGTVQRLVLTRACLS